MATIPLDAFKKNPGGSWSAVKPIIVTSPTGESEQIGPGISFAKGVLFMGIDLAALLDEKAG